MKLFCNPIINFKAEEFKRFIIQVHIMETSHNLNGTVLFSKEDGLKNRCKGSTKECKTVR